MCIFTKIFKKNLFGIISTTKKKPIPIEIDARWGISKASETFKKLFEEFILFFFVVGFAMLKFESNGSSKLPPNETAAIAAYEVVMFDEAYRFNDELPAVLVK